jgi:AbrB family looped-hinge helix DNA binding protein
VYRATLSARGQIVIPAELRKRLSLLPGASFRLYDKGDKIVLIRETKDPVGQGFGILKKEAAPLEEKG